VRIVLGSLAVCGGVCGRWCVVAKLLDDGCAVAAESVAGEGVIEPPDDLGEDQLVTLRQLADDLLRRMTPLLSCQGFIVLPAAQSGNGLPQQLTHPRVSAQ